MIMMRAEFSLAGWRADDPCAVGAALVRFVGNGKALANRAGSDGWCGGARLVARAAGDAARLVARRGWLRRTGDRAVRPADRKVRRSEA